MKYRVRNQDGELEFPSYRELQEAMQVGFVEPEDEVLAENSTEWKRASQVVQGDRKRSWIHAIDLWVALAVALGLLSLWSLATLNYVIGGVSVFVLLNVIGRITWKASKRKS